VVVSQASGTSDLNMKFADLMVGEWFTHRGRMFLKREDADSRREDGAEFIFNSEAEVEKISGLASQVGVQSRGMITNEFTVEVGFDPKGFLRITTAGVIDEESLSTIFSMAATAHERHACNRALVDHRESELRLNADQIFWVPKKVEGHGIHKNRAALLFDRIGNDEKFLETVCTNRGIRVKVFTDADQAATWVMDETV